MEGKKKKKRGKYGGVTSVESNLNVMVFKWWVLFGIGDGQRCVGGQQTVTRWDDSSLTFRFVWWMHIGIS